MSGGRADLASQIFRTLAFGLSGNRAAAVTESVRTEAREVSQRRFFSSQALASTLGLRCLAAVNPSHWLGFQSNSDPKGRSQCCH
jgi:hypothetical protein